MSEVNNSQDLITTPQRTIRYYACGGTGINILRGYREGEPDDKLLHRAEEFYTFVDTSRANLGGVLASESFLIKDLDGNDLDGGGSDRGRNINAINAALPKIKLAHPPADVCVVAFGASGSSGSTIGPMLAIDLLAAGHTVALIVNGNHSSLKHTTNTIGTIMGLQNEGIRVGRPIIMCYTEDDRKKTNEQNNAMPRLTIASLAILASGKNGSLDSADVQSLFNYHTVTHHNPGLAQLTIMADAAKVSEYKPHVISMAALLNDDKQVLPEIEVDYVKAAYLTDNHNVFKNSLFFMVSMEALNDTLKDLNARKDKAIQQRKSSETQALLVGGVESDAKTGLSLF